MGSILTGHLTQLIRQGRWFYDFFVLKGGQKGLQTPIVC